MIDFAIFLSLWIQVGDQVVLRLADFVRSDLAGLLWDLSHLGAGLVMALLRLLNEPDVHINYYEHQKCKLHQINDKVNVCFRYPKSVWRVENDIAFLPHNVTMSHGLVASYDLVNYFNSKKDFLITRNCCRHREFSVLACRLSGVKSSS